MGILNGSYDNFTQEWYKKVGVQYALAMFISIFTPFSEIATALTAFVKRYFDRSRQPSYKLEGSDGIQTKRVLQEDVEQLYTGDEIESYVVYSQYFTGIWGILVFSSGMPALYIIGFLTYLV